MPKQKQTKKQLRCRIHPLLPFLFLFYFFKKKPNNVFRTNPLSHIQPVHYSTPSVSLSLHPLLTSLNSSITKRASTRKEQKKDQIFSEFLGLICYSNPSRTPPRMSYYNQQQPPVGVPPPQGKQATHIFFPK